MIGRGKEDPPVIPTCEVEGRDFTLSGTWAEVSLQLQQRIQENPVLPYRIWWLFPTERKLAASVLWNLP